MKKSSFISVWWLLIELIHCATLVMVYCFLFLVSCFLFLVMALFAKLLEQAWYESEILMAHFTLVAACNRKEY